MQTLVDKEIQDFKNWKNWYPAFQNENVTVINNSAKPGVINSASLKDAEGKKINLDLIESESEPDTIIVIVRSQSSTKVDYQFIFTPHSNG